MASLSVDATLDYFVGPNDTLGVTIPDLFKEGEINSFDVRAMEDGTVRLPLVEPVKVGSMNLADAQQAIENAYGKTIVKSPKASISLVEEALFDIAVMGEVTEPGVYPLPRHQNNDVAHALAMAGGETDYAADFIEVHRRMTHRELIEKLTTSEAIGKAVEEIVLPECFSPGDGSAAVQSTGGANTVLRVSLRGGPVSIFVDNQLLAQDQLANFDASLIPGDVVVMPRKPDETFYVVGPLDRSNVINFRVSDLGRRLGNAFLLPTDRDIDVVTAGYIDPIESPSTVTVHRTVPGEPPMLIRVDLIKARYDWNENIYVQAGDIIYLNPDGAWWFRRTFDRIVPDLLTIPYAEGFNPRNGNN
jgi:polysaccharide export outer membrane protein